MTARPLFDPGPATGAMTERQQQALDHLTNSHPNGVRSIDLGRHLHILRGCPYCSETRLCKYAMSTGEEVGNSEPAISRSNAGSRTHGSSLVRL